MRNVGFIKCCGSARWCVCVSLSLSVYVHIDVRGRTLHETIRLLRLVVRIPW